MQSSSASNSYKRKCCDCQGAFTTASELLRHFARHVCEKNKIDLARAISKSETECDISLFIRKTKKRKKTLLENIFNNSDLNTAFQMHHTPLNSLGSGETSSEIPNINFGSHVDLVHEIGIRARDKVKSSTEVSLLKCDFQKRLENCITKLSVKKDVENYAEVLSITPSISCIQTDQGSNVSQENDEFSPINFCRVTMNSCDEPVYCKTIQEKFRNYDKEFFRTSSRKQLLPKKIMLSNTINIDDTEDKEHKSPVKSESCSITLNMPNSSPKKKYFCHLCSRTFGWSTDLKRHILTHTGERPFKCTTCDATFTRNFLLQKHEARVHHLNGLTKGKEKLDLKSFTYSDTSSSITGTSVRRKVPTKCLTQKTYLEPETNGFLNWRKYLPKETSVLECNNSSSFDTVPYEALNVV